ncbi:MAG: PHP domain-containing protein [Oscillospiraceae bacterium]|nr:PHP domain-containing protein [Oscillospiraceae bacterium]
MPSVYYDFHLHSCLSPCADDDCTPANLAGMCKLAGLDAVALTDHNTSANCRAFLKHADRHGLIALPGMELTTSEEVHVVCLFAALDAAERFSGEIYARLPDVKNRPERFGNQRLCDEDDQPAGQLDKFLLTATDIGIYDVAAAAARLGGIAFPAHIDREAFSLLSNLGLWDDGMGFAFAERTRGADLSRLPGIPYLINSDAHRLDAVPDAEFRLEAEFPTAQSIIDALRKL